MSRLFLNRSWSLIAILILFFSATPVYAQMPANCHLITADERAALTLREVAIPTTGFFCDNDKALLFGSCTTDPLPVLQSRYTPGPDSAKEGPSGITRLNAEFACRLSRYITAYPATCIYSAYRSVETQQKLWEEALLKYGSPEEARKHVAPPGSSKHNQGLAADLCGVSDAARVAAPTFGLIYRLGNEPWHIEGDGITTPIGELNYLATTPVSPGTPPSVSSTLSSTINILQLYQLLSLNSSTATQNNPAAFSTQPFNSQPASSTGTFIYPNFVSNASIADALLALLRGDAFTVFGSASTTLTLSTSTTIAEEDIRPLMLRIIELLAVYLQLLQARSAL